MVVVTICCDECGVMLAQGVNDLNASTKLVFCPKCLESLGHGNYKKATRQWHLWHDPIYEEDTHA